MELEGEVQDQAQKIIEMPQRDRATSASENQPSSASAQLVDLDKGQAVAFDFHK